MKQYLPRCLNLFRKWKLSHEDARVISVDNSVIIHAIVLHPQKGYMGYGKKIFAALIAANPNIKRIKLDVQKRNKTALSFYRRLGFIVDGEEMQPVGESEEAYFNLSLAL